MVLFAIAATGSGMDRIIAETPSVSPAAGGVPALFADASLRRAAAIELAAGRFPAAAQLARRATIRSPLEPASTALLGAAWLGEGRIAAADSAFRVSGQLGWRDTVTQTYWMQVALLGGDYAVAAQRLDAMLRREPAQAGRPELLAPFESSAAGRAMLVGRLAQRPGWLPVYFNPTGVLGPAQLAQRAQVAALLSKDTPLGCGGISPLVRRLITEDAVTPAHDLWQQHCAPARGAIISDPDLTGGLGNDPSPLAGRSIPTVRSGCEAPAAAAAWCWKTPRPSPATSRARCWFSHRGATACRGGRWGPTGASATGSRLFPLAARKGPYLSRPGGHRTPVCPGCCGLPAHVKDNS